MFLIADDNGTKYHKRVPNGFSLTYSTMRQFLTDSYPNACIYTPLENAPKGAHVVSVYLSDNCDGVGRVQDRFFQWAVIPCEK